MVTWPDIPGQELMELPANGSLRVVIESAPPAEPLEGEAAACWGELCRLNPRLHDGDMLSCVGVDLGAEVVIRARRDRFWRLAVQGLRTGSGGTELNFGVCMLGVKGLIVARDGGGEEHVLIARRGRQTRVYGDMWEVAPAGGIGVPRDASAAELGAGAVMETLVLEAEEELGIDVRARCQVPRAVAIVRDSVARSVEVIVRADWVGPIDPRRAACASGCGGAGACAWEYSDSAWLARRDAREFDRRSGASIVGPMRAVLRWMGWS